jgi:hypothetical protein
MGNGPEMKSNPARGPVTTEEGATMPGLYGSEPGFTPMTQDDFVTRANCKVGHTSISAEILSKNA